jgi:hypothetical protein
MAARISVDTDTWWHLRSGQWILENRAVPQEDPFSYTRLGEKWQYPGWIVQVPMYLIYEAFGPGGLNLWTAGMVSLTFAFLWRTLQGGEFLRAFVLILAAATSGVYWAARPYMVTFLLAAVYLWILEDHRWGRADRLGWLPVLMILWANSHGGFAVGFLLWGVYFVGTFDRLNVGTLERLNVQTVWNHIINQRKLLLVGLLMVVAVAINPSGPVMLLYPFKTVSIGSLREYIQEWQSPDFHSLQVQPFLWLLILTLGALGFSRRRASLTDFLSLAGFAYMAFLAGRNIALFALVAPLVLTRHLDPLISLWARRLGVRYAPARGVPPTRVQRILNGLILGVLLLAVAGKAILIFPVEVNQAHFDDILPVQAVAYIKVAKPPGRLFNTYNWGGYLLWDLPDYPVFIDGRTDLYNDEVINTWLQVIRAEEGWQEVLEKWKIELILMEPNLPLASQLPGNGWQAVYEDGLAVVYQRLDSS